MDTLQTLITQLGYYYDSYGDRYYTSSYNDPAAAGLTVMAMLFMLFFGVIAYVVMAILLGRIFKKAGVEAWKAWVPFYNHWTLLELGGQQGFWAVLVIVPFVNIVAAIFTYIAMYNIGLKLGKDGAFVLWGIFIPIVWYIWLAVDDSKWKGKAGGAKKTV
jgi:hypothetical protein